MEYGSIALYNKWVIDASLNQNVSGIERLVRLVGFNGCITSTDVTHIGMLSFASWAQIIHKGFKLDMLLRTFNMNSGSLS